MKKLIAIFLCLVAFFTTTLTVYASDIQPYSNNVGSTNTYFSISSAGVATVKNTYSDSLNRVKNAKIVTKVQRTIYDCYIARQYRIFDSYDADYSYHTIDMGRAGKVYINDYTNTVLLARDEIGIEGNIMPVELVRYFDLGHNSTYNSSGHSAWWNYGSYLQEITTYNYKWQAPDGSSIYFIPDPSKNTNGNYKYWIDVDNDGYKLELDTTQRNKFSNAKLVTPENYTYMLESTTIGDKTTNYLYTATGALKEVSRAVSGLTNSLENMNTKYSYSHDRITSVSHNGIKYNFTYNSFGNVKKVDLENISDLISYKYSNDYKQNLNSIESISVLSMLSSANS